MLASEHPAETVEPLEPDSTVSSVPSATLGFGAKRAIWIVLCYVAVQFGVVFVVVMTATIVSLIDRHGRPAAKLSPGTFVAIGAVGALVATAVGYRMARRSFSRSPSGELERTLGFVGVPSRQIVLAAASGVLVGAFNVFVVIRLFPPSATQDLGLLAAASAEGGWVRHVLVVFAVFIAPPTEELMLRGVLFAGLSRSLGVLAAACIATLVFALLHVSSLSPYWPALMAVSLLGAAAQTARILSGSLVPGIAMHVAYNVVLVLPVYLQP